MLKNPLKLFRYLGYAEGVSFLLLLVVAMPLKYMFQMPIAVTIVGALHGALFVGYVLIAAYTTYVKKWEFLTFLGAVIASVLPFGPFVYDARVLKRHEHS